MVDRHHDLWCDVDDCPALICNGPHVSHVCNGGDIVTLHALVAVCPLGCGHTTDSGGSRQEP